MEVYRVSKSVPHVPTPLVYHDRLFLWADNGILTCAAAATGEKLWQGRVGGNYHGSPVCVGGRLYCIDLDGEVVVVDALADELRVLARHELSEECSSTPAVSGGVMYLRTRSRLFSLGEERHADVVARSCRLSMARGSGRGALSESGGQRKG